MRLLTLFALLCPFYVLASDFKSISSFGDSLSDCGNKFAVSQEFNLATKVLFLPQRPLQIGKAGQVMVEYGRSISLKC